MFYDCLSLKYLNISTFTKFIHIGPLLGGCKSLSILDMSSFLDFNDKGYPIFVRFSDSGTIYINHNFTNYAEKNLPAGWKIEIVDNK